MADNKFGKRISQGFENATGSGAWERIKSALMGGGKQPANADAMPSPSPDPGQDVENEKKKK